MKATFVVGGQHPFRCIYHSTPPSVRTPPGAHTNLASWFPHASLFFPPLGVCTPLFSYCAYAFWCSRASILLVYARLRTPTPLGVCMPWRLHAMPPFCWYPHPFWCLSAPASCCHTPTFSWHLYISCFLHASLCLLAAWRLRTSWRLRVCCCSLLSCNT